MVNLENVVLEMAKKAIIRAGLLGEEGRVRISPESDKDTCVAEKKVYDTVREVADEHFDSYELLAEGFDPIVKGESPNLKIIVDPLDGTAYYARQNSINGFPVSVVVSIVDGPKYKDVKAAAIGDLQTQEIWYASDGVITSSSRFGEVSVGGNEEHDPVWASDFYFPENAHLRTLLRHPKNPELDRFENLNVGSVAEQVAKVACGEIDLFYNAVGPKGYELAAMYRIVIQAGGHCLHLPTGIEVGEIYLEFDKIDKRIPIVISKDRESAEKVCSLHPQIERMIND